MATDSTEEINSSDSVRAGSRKNRVFVFYDFLLRTYFPSRKDLPLSPSLSRHSVILDVAGGKGDLSWLLSNVSHINSIVVDPRHAVSHSHMVKSITYLQKHPEEAKRRAVPNRPTFQPLAAILVGSNDLRQRSLEEFRQPPSLRLLVNQKLVEAVKSFKETSCMTQWETFWQTALHQGLTTQPLLGKRQKLRSTDQESFLEIQSRVDRESENQPGLVDDAMLRNAHAVLDLLLHRTSLVVGFHPDQATDPCIDLAYELGVPFCIVPCCVFPKEFPDRTFLPEPDNTVATTTANSASESGTRERKPVKKYHELLVYLREKIQGKFRLCRTHELEFYPPNTCHDISSNGPHSSSRNIVLYTLPEDVLRK